MKMVNVSHGDKVFALGCLAAEQVDVIELYAEGFLDEHGGAGAKAGHGHGDMEMRGSTDDGGSKRAVFESAGHVGETGDLVLAGDFFEESGVGIAGGEFRSTGSLEATQMAFADAAAADDENPGVHGAITTVGQVLRKSPATCLNFGQVVVD
jgi:hypothetical protein